MRFGRRRQAPLEAEDRGYDRFSIGADFLVTRGYGGHGIKVRLEDGKDYPGCRELGGETHACGAVALTPNYSFAITLAGLNVREVQTGKLLWRSPGFAPRACVNPALANGRVFWTSGANGMVYCWEPVAEAIAAFTGLRREYRGSWIDCVAAERLEKLQPPPLDDEP